ncbi:MAG: thiamine-phosphate kinase [Candidatus Methanophagaceae archaeon]|nr:MAG: thiamine-phosphate kinase [Methanophagales archaeon]
MKTCKTEQVERLGEVRLVERITKQFSANANANEQVVTAGAGEDDCAVLDLDEAKAKANYNSKYLVVTTDTLQESTHFPAGISPFQIGWSAVAVNLSDIAAMGARPFAFTLALGVPAETETVFVDEVVQGVKKCASAYNTAVVGGDTTRSKEVVLTGTCLGFADRPVRRAGAEVGDLVCVTGSLGNAALGQKIVEREVAEGEKGGKKEMKKERKKEMKKERKKEGEEVELKVPKKVEEAAKKALFQPVPRVKEGVVLADSGLVTSMIDISDGLALSLAALAKSSKVGFEIYEEKVPVADLRLRRELAFYYGGDYELLFTLRASGGAEEGRAEAGARGNAELLRRLQKEVKMSVVGRVLPAEEGLYFKREDGTKEEVKIKGYQHF